MFSKSARRLLLFVALSILLVVWVWITKKPSQDMVDHPRLVAGVAMRDVTFFSQALHREMR